MRFLLAGLPILLILLGLLVATLVISYGNSASLEILAAHLNARQEIVMTEQDATILESSWCWKHTEPGGQSEEHTKVTVTTVKEETESITEFKARHLARCAAQKEETPANCAQHTYP